MAPRRRPAVQADPSAHEEAPPPSRMTQRPGNPAALMTLSWIDPADVTPDARREPRRITGWRTYDPLRKMQGHANSGISFSHVMAADRLREAWDLARLGYSGERPMVYVATVPMPRFGLGPAALEQMVAIRDVRRVIRMFSPPQLEMLDSIVLRNTTLRAWTGSRRPPSTTAVEKGRLLVILDRLAAHYDTELREDVQAGRREW